MANQNIIEKQQVRGTSASIAQYAGKEGQIVFNKDNKRLHVMSGTVGQSTQYLSTAQAATKTQLGAKLDAATYNSEKASFATKSQIPDVSTLATKAEVTSGLADKVNTSTYTADKATFALKTEIPDTSGLATKTQLGSYATTTALTQGLAGKLDKTGKATSAATADSVPWTGITGAPTIPDISELIPKGGNRGVIGGYQTTINRQSISGTTADSMYTDLTGIMVMDGTAGTSWTKVMKITSTDAVTVSCSDLWKWVGGSAPQIKSPGLLVCHWNNDGGFLNFLSGAA